MADQVKWTVSNDRDDDEAWIENERGVECICIKRTDRTALTESEFDVIIDLIAAAPEMLACLREAKAELLDLYEAAYPDDESDNDTTRVIDRVIEVISKATGV